MTSHAHTAVWLDHKEARVFHVDLAGFDVSKVQSPDRHIHRHPKGAAEEHKHPADLPHFFAALVKELGDAEQILVLGPSTAKLHFVRYLHKNAPTLEAKVVGLETLDHPTDPQLVAYAKKYFGMPDPRLG